MRTKITTYGSIFLSIFGIGLANTVMAAEPPPPLIVAETWACSYKDGKDWGDKSKARDNLVTQIEKAGLKKVRAIHWTQRKGMAPVDTVWFDLHDSLAAFGKASDAWDASGIGPGTDAQFGKLEDCTAGLSTIRPIHQQPQQNDDDGDGTTLIANLACNFVDGAGAQHIPELTRHMGSVMKSFGADGPGFAGLRQPVTSGADYPDLFLFSVFENMTHWTKYVEQLFSTEAGQSMRSHMDMVVDCNISMWRTEQVVTPNEG